MGIGELDLATVSSYRQRYRLSHNGHAWNELGDSDFLRCIGAAAEAEDGRLHPTVAGLLMFGHDWRIAEELPNYFLNYFLDYPYLCFESVCSTFMSKYFRIIRILPEAVTTQIGRASCRERV